jgi:hypothetical protein
MASLIFNSFWEDLARGAIDLDTDTIKVMLVGSGYTPSKDSDLKRSAVTSQASGTGYTAGGATCTVTITKDLANDRLNVQLGAVSWATSTVSARGAVYYKSRGGASSADELVAYNDFGTTLSSSASTFSVAASTIVLQN